MPQFFHTIASFFGLGFLAATLSAAELSVPKPPERGFISDQVQVLSAQEHFEIMQICNQLLSAKVTPIIVVTIDSMDRYGGRGMTIETFSTRLFNQWRIGHAVLNSTQWNTGILVVVSTADRKARIELGGGWAHEQDETCTYIMNDLMVPEFKDGRYGEGIKVGVQALANMAQGLSIPSSKRNWWRPYVIVLGLIIVVVWLIRNMGSLLNRATVRANPNGSGSTYASRGYYSSRAEFRDQASSDGEISSSGGWFKGGSFGGGSSRGGGASGSW